MTPWCPPSWESPLAARGVTVPVDTGVAMDPDAVTVHHDNKGWRLIGASRRGRLHAHRGEHREDAVACRTWPAGWCLAVADGAGSSAWSRIGSTLATTVLADVVGNATTAASLRDRLQHALSTVMSAMRELADQVGEPGKALRTTLLAVVVHEGQLATLQIGDGAIMLRTAGGDIHLPYAPAVGEYSGEVSHFLPDDGALDVGVASIQLHDASKYDVAVLCTDGVEDPWYPLARYGDALMAEWAGRPLGDRPLPEGYIAAEAPVVMHGDRSAADASNALVAWLTFEKRGENDDRTAAIAWRRPG